MTKLWWGNTVNHSTFASWKSNKKNIRTAKKLTVIQWSLYNAFWLSHHTDRRPLSYKDVWLLETAGRPRWTRRVGGDQVQQSQSQDLNHAAELKCQGRALTFPGNPTPCPLSAGEQRTQKGAGQGELCHRDEGRGEEQRRGGWCWGGEWGGGATVEKEFCGGLEGETEKRSQIWGKKGQKKEVGSDEWQKRRRGGRWREKKGRGLGQKRVGKNGKRKKDKKTQLIEHDTERHWQ